MGQVSEQQKKLYIESLYNEMRNRGLTNDEIPVVIGKTGFMEALDKYPKEQFHYEISDAVDEILLIAAKKK